MRLRLASPLLPCASLLVLACSGDAAENSPAASAGRAGRSGAAGAAGQSGAFPSTAGASGATAGAGGATAGASGGGPGGSPAGGGGGMAGAGTGGAGQGGAGTPLPVGTGVLGYWCGPPAQFATEAQYDAITEAGFNLVSNACDGSTYNPGYNLAMLSLAQARGMRAIVSDARVAQALADAGAGKDAAVGAGLDAVVAEYGKSTSLAGYHVVDEPGAGAFPALAQVVGGLRARDPARLAYINLLPMYATPAQLGASSYDAYVQGYLETVQPDVVSWDFYPFYTASDDDRFFENMAIVRARALAAKRPFWQFVQSISFNAHRATTAAEKRWVAMQSLAYGAQGVWYFTYWTPPQTAENFGAGIIDASGSKTAQYAEVKAINQSFAALARYTTAATSEGVFHQGPLDRGTGPRVPGAFVDVPSFARVTVGLFTVPGHAYALLANRDYGASVALDPIFAVPPERLERLDPASGLFVPLVAKAVAEGSQGHVELAPGDAALVHLAGPIGPGPAGAEAMVGLVRGDAGSLSVVDSRFGEGTLRAAGWDDCPAGYTLAGKDFQSNGFWLCARNDLLATTFHVGNVVGDAGTLYEVSGGVATKLGDAGWDQCPAGSVLGRRFDSNGFWLCH